MRRLFSTFARGWPGIGLLLMRLVLAITLIDQGVTQLWSQPAIASAVLPALTVIAGFLLIAGLWTPLAAAGLGIIEFWKIHSQCSDPLIHMLLGTVAVALLLLGPGAWSVDARLFGWKRLDVRPRQK